MAQEHRSRRGVPAWGCKGFRIAREPLFSLDKPRIVRYTPLVNRLPLKRLGLAPLFDPSREQSAWVRLLDELNATLLPDL